MWDLNEYRDSPGGTDIDRRATQLHGMPENTRGRSSWGKRDILIVTAAVLFISGIGIGAWISPVGISMLLVGILLAGIAVNERLISWTAIGALGLYLTVTAIVLLFSIAADATDLGVNWLEHISWFFRVVGVTVSLPILGFLWYVVSEYRRVYSQMPSEHPPSDLPAAAVSELVDENQSPRTPYVIVKEMLQAGTLEVGSEGGAPPLYHFTPRPGRKQKWEQTVSDALPREPMSRFNLLKRLNEPGLGLRQQIHDYLRHRGLLHSENATRTRNCWFASLAVLGAALMSVGLALWMVRLGPAWPVPLAIVVVASIAWAWISYRQIEVLSKFTADGKLEIRQWRGFRAHLESFEFEVEEETKLGTVDSLTPYALALNLMPLMQQKPSIEASDEPPSDLVSAMAESWRQDKAATVVGFASGFYLGSWLYPGEGIAEHTFNGILNLAEFSATFGSFDAFGGGLHLGGGDADAGGLGDFGDFFGGGGGGDIDISF